MNCGIYYIKNAKNYKMYIGLSRNLRIRKNQHLYELRNNKHNNFHLQNSFNYYGESCFTFGVLEYCNEQLLEQKEKDWIFKFKTNKKKYGYNLTDGGEKGYKLNNTDFVHKRNEMYKEYYYHMNENGNDILHLYKKEMDLLLELKNNGDKLIMFELIKYSKIYSNNFYLSHKYIADKVGYELTQVKNIINKLQDDNLISIENGGVEKGKENPTPNKYKILIEYKNEDNYIQVDRNIGFYESVILFYSMKYLKSKLGRYSFDKNIKSNNQI